MSEANAQALYDLLTPSGQAPHVTLEALAGLPGPFLLEVKLNRRSGRGRWWQSNSAGYTDQFDRAGLYDKDSDEVRRWDPEADNYRLVDARVLYGPLNRLLRMWMQLPMELAK